MGVAQLLVVQMAVFLAALLLAAGLHKLIRREHLRSVIQEFAAVPARLALPAVLGVALAEMVTGVMLWWPAYREAGGALAALLWGGYLLLILRAIAQGRRDVDCGCTFGAAQRPLGTYQVARTAVLTGVALLVALCAARTAAGPAAASQMLAACTLVALYGALDQVMVLAAPRGGELL